MNKVKLGDIIQFNPPESIKKGNIAKKISMEKLLPHTKKISSFENAIYSAGPKFKNNDTLLAKITPCLENGKTAFVDILDENEVAFGSSEFIVLRAIKNISDANYVYYLARSPKFRNRAIGCMEGTSGRKRVNDKHLQNEIFEMPNIQTQTAIAHILSSFDNKIELNNKINKELENMAKTIYEYWFVQNVDKNWERKRLEELGVNVIRGVTYNKNDIKTLNDRDVIGILRATNINGNVIDLDNLVYVDKSLISENQKLKPFDILITMSSGSKDHIGKNGLFCFDNANVAFGAFCSKIDVREEYKLYIYEHFQSEKFKKYVKNCCLGTNINNLNNEMIKDILITIPPTPILQKFNKTVSPIFSDIIKNRQENACLAQLRDFMLPLLMNGQVKVNTRK